MKLSILSCFSVFIKWGLLFFALPISGAQLELVQSVPLETPLAVSDLRQTAPVWLEMIQNAGSTIDIEQFYVAEERIEALTPIIQAIENSANKGVRVRLLVDEKFFKTYPETVTRLAGITNIESRTVSFADQGGVQHAKFFVIDKKDSFLGSQNFDWRALAHIHELGVRVQDSLIGSQLTAVFEMDWSKAKKISDKSKNRAHGYDADNKEGKQLQTSKNHQAELVATPKGKLPNGVRFSLDAILDLINGANVKIRIQTMSFSTTYKAGERWDALSSAIRNAAKRGVSVELMVDGSRFKKSGSGLLKLAEEKNISVKTVIIPEWSGGKIDFARLIHSKYMTVDGKAAWLGTANWSKGYFFDSRDVGLIISETEIIAKMDLVYDTLWDSKFAKRINAQ